MLEQPPDLRYPRTANPLSLISAKAAVLPSLFLHQPGASAVPLTRLVCSTNLFNVIIGAYCDRVCLLSVRLSSKNADYAQDLLSATSALQVRWAAW